MHIFLYGNKFLRIKISNHLGSAKIWKKSKRGQRLLIKFIQIKTLEGESNYKIYNFFSKTKKKANITCNSNLLHKTDSKQNWQVLKEITGKQKTKSNILPWERKVDRIIVQNQKEVSQEFSKYFILIWSKKSAILKNILRFFDIS